MPENKISEIVAIHSGYTNAVSLSSELFDDDRNVGRMLRYRPIKSHRLAFTKLSRSLQIKDKRCYLLTGAYGTGKSHLCLMFANYMETPAAEKPMPEFFAHFSDADLHASDELRSKRQSGRYLIALCEWGGKEEFDEIVLQAVDKALHRAGFDEDFDTIYLQAAQKIDEWKASPQPYFYDHFQSELNVASPGTTVNQFKQRLRAFDFATLTDFKNIHQKVTSAPFNYDKANLIEILTGVLTSQKFKERFLGVLVLFDEFGDTMESGNLKPKAFQRFAELCAEPPADGAKLVFVSTAHKSLNEYAKPYNTNDMKVASDRIEQVALTPEGIEDIIAAIIEPKKDSNLWKEHVAPRAASFNEFLTECNRLKLFEWLNSPKILSSIIENIYPMHPMATYALLRLSQDVASNNRSVYTFFSGDIESGGDPGSYTEFVATSPILTGNRLNLYTADSLFDYFGETLKSGNKELRETVRNHIKDYENSKRALNQVAESDFSLTLSKDDRLISRLMNVMLIFEIVGIPNRADNLRFGLYCSPSEGDELKNRVDTLVQKDVIYRQKDTGILEFKKATAADLDKMIEAYVHDEKNHPPNLVAELNSLVPLGSKDTYFEAKDYNSQYSEDKRLERRIIRAVDLEEETDTPQGKRTYFDKLEDEITAEISKKGEFEGIALYVACEEADDIAKAKSSCARNKSDRIVVGIPKLPIPLFDAILELKALKSIEASPEKKNFTAQDNSALSAKLNGYGHTKGATARLEELRDRMMDVKEIAWYGKHNQQIFTDDKKPYDITTSVMTVLFGEKRNKFAHDDYNKLHTKTTGAKNSVKEAVEALLRYSVPLIIDTSFAEGRGDIRYLRNVLLNNGALKSSGKPDGAKLRCEIETNPKKFQDKLPALADMVRQITSLPPNGEINMLKWARDLRKPPYGQGTISLAISLSFFRRTFGDSIRFKIDKNSVGDMPLSSVDDVLNLIEGKYPNAFLSYRPLTSNEKELVNVVYNVFGTDGPADVTAHSVIEAYNALKNWWDDLPALSRTAKLYNGENNHSLRSFIDVMSHIAAKDGHSFLRDNLIAAFGFDEAQAITPEIVETLAAELPQRRDRIDAAHADVEKKIILKVRDIFHVDLDTYDDIRQGIANWYNSLDSNQKDIHAKWQTNDSRTLIQYLGSISDLSNTFLSKIPNSIPFGGQQVDAWMTDKTADYLQQITAARELIDANRRKVEAPMLKPKGTFTKESSRAISFNGSLILEFEAPAAGATTWVADGSFDPTDPTSTRRKVTDAESIIVTDHKEIRFAAQDAEGNWSNVETVTLTNADKKFEPSVSFPNILGERSTSFTFPTDFASLKVTCRKLFAIALAQRIISEDELRGCVNDAIEEATKE